MRSVPSWSICILIKLARKFWAHTLTPFYSCSFLFKNFLYFIIVVWHSSAGSGISRSPPQVLSPTPVNFPCSITMGGPSWTAISPSCCYRGVSQHCGHERCWTVQHPTVSIFSTVLLEIRFWSGCTEIYSTLSPHPNISLSCTSIMYPLKHSCPLLLHLGCLLEI